MVNTATADVVKAATCAVDMPVMSAVVKPLSELPRDTICCVVNAAICAVYSSASDALLNKLILVELIATKSRVSNPTNC